MVEDWAPIGIFDSGFGGLTIFREISRMLPRHDLVYLGDNARTPYGNRSFETVYRFARQGVGYLLELGCPLVIMACNTASAKALRNIQQLDLPATYPDRRVLGVIRPTVEAVSSHTKTNQVGLWATLGTVQSESFVLELAQHAPKVTLVQQACPLLVSLVEAGELEGPGLDYFIHKYWSQTITRAPDIDCLLLACTHYPLLNDRIREVVPRSVALLTQGELVAPSLQDYLKRHPELGSRLSKNKKRQFLTTDSSKHFDHLAEIFMGLPVSSQKVELSPGRWPNSVP